MPTNSPRPSGANRPPKYSRQKEKGRSDRAYVWVDGKKVTLGKYGSPDSRKRYAELIAGSESAETLVPSDKPTVSELILTYLKHARQYYRAPDGENGREYELTLDVCKLVRHQAGHLPAIDFGPKKLKAIRQELIDLGLSRKYINKQIDRVRRMFRWGAEEELIPANIPQALSMVVGLKKGRSDANELPPIRPVDADVVEATIVELPDLLADMVRVQLLTGMRPGELVKMRPQDIDRSGPEWLYTPPKHKTEWRGHHRTIAIGPKAQGVLLHYLARAADECLFQPRDSEAKRLAEREANRKVPKSCGNRRGTNRKANPKRTPGIQYSVDSYRHAVNRAARRAKVEQWSPHRLRHSAATEVRKQFGLDACQAVLGHRGAKITEVYAELDTAKAKEVARRIG
jgi:integrase